jgi:hypothetical protein
MSKLRSVSAALGLAALLLTSGCGGGGGDGDDAAKEAADASPTPSFSTPTAAATTFVDPTAAENKWLPLKPGTQWVREGTTLRGKREVPHKVISTVTDVVREIDGVKALLVLDHQLGGGEIVQKSVDYFAQDSEGNVWTMGGVSEVYEGGKLVELEEAWLSGGKGAKGGILMPADPTKETPPWTIAQPPDEDADAAQFERIQPKECVPFGCYEDVLVVREGTAKAVDTEFKYYAAGVGQIRNEPRKKKGEDVERLINVIKLGADGLAEASKDALRMDAAGAEEEPKVFGDSKAKRIS